MSELVTEILLRLAKVVVSIVVGTVVYGLALLAGASSSVELFLLCYLVGAASILLVESGPF